MEDPRDDSPEEAEAESGAEPAPGRLHGLLPRVTVLVLCLLLSIDALAVFSHWRANRDRLSEILRRHAGAAAGDDLAGDLARVAFERTPHHAQLAVARKLVYDVLAAGDGAAPLAAEGLAVARVLALEALRQQPNSWQASMFLGAATYLDGSLRSDRRLYTAAAKWQEPLLRAVAGARGKAEPRRLLAAAYLETWAALSEARKAETVELVKTLFEDDPASFDRLGPAWFEVVEDRQLALSAVPDRVAPWQTLKRGFAAARDWDSFLMAHERYLEALARELTQTLEDAGQRLRLGDLAGSRDQCLRVVAGSPRDGAFATLVSRALELYPPGLHGLRYKQKLDAWLQWALELDGIGLRPFTPKVMRRLTDASGELDPPDGARAALIADDAYHVGRYEKLGESKLSKEWAPFLIAKSRWLIDRAELDEAALVLEQVHRSARSGAAYWAARVRLARATGELADLATAEQRLAELHKTEWRAAEWRWRGRRGLLEPYVEVPGAGLSIAVTGAPAGGAVVDLLWDGTSVAVREVAADQTIELAMAVTPGPHLLELTALAGGEVYPGSVRLLAD